MEAIFVHSHSITLTENHIKQLHGDLLKYSAKDEYHRGNYKTNTNHVSAFDADGNEVGIVFKTAIFVAANHLSQHGIGKETWYESAQQAL